MVATPSTRDQAAEATTDPSRGAAGTQSHHGLREQKVGAAFRAQKLTAVPSDLLALKNLVHIDLSENQITRFPGQFVAMEMLRLEVLQLQDNLLYVLEDLLALASSPRLRELNLLRNPLRLQNNRVYLLEALFQQRGSDESLLLMAHKDDDLKGAGAASTVHPPHTMKYRKRLPRQHGFPMLQKLNDEWITDAEIHDVEEECGHRIAYYRPTTTTSNRSSDATRSRKNQQNSGRSSGNALQPRSGTKSLSSGYEGSDHLRTRSFDGNRMTIKQMLKNASRSAGIPMARIIQRLQIDVDNGDEVVAEEEENERGHEHLEQLAATSTRNAHDGDGQNHKAAISAPVTRGEVLDADKLDEQRIIHRLFQTPTPTTHPTQRQASFTASKSPRSNGSSKETRGDHRPATRDADEEDGLEDEPWNYPISTFDTLGSEDRQYVRYKSKQCGGGSTLERDDHFFDSTIFLDCVAQAERSRRLTVRAVDLLSQRGGKDDHGEKGSCASLLASQSTPALTMMPSCSAASSLVDTMNANFTRQQDRAKFEKIMAFQEQQLSVGDSLHIQAGACLSCLVSPVSSFLLTRNSFAPIHLLQAVGDYYQSEHMAQKQKNSLLFLAQQQNAPSSSLSSTAEASLEDSLSKVKLRNAVDLANTLLDPKQQKHMLQMLIDADENVIEEERIAQEQTTHRYKLHLINTRSYTAQNKEQLDHVLRKRASSHISASPWQKRNWRATDVQQRQVVDQRASKEDVSLEEATRTLSSSPLRKATISKPNHKQRHQHVEASCAQVDAALAAESAEDARKRTVNRFRTIETVEKAALDPLVHVNSHDLLVRCSEIRQHADKHMRALHAHRDRFLDDEAQWEHMRQDPTNLVRRHLKRRLYRDAQEIQIGTTQVFYSPLFH